MLTQRLGEEEEGEGAVWKFGNPGGRVEGAQEEEEVVRPCSPTQGLLRYYKDRRLPQFVTEIAWTHAKR